MPGMRRVHAARMESPRVRVCGGTPGWRRTFHAAADPGATGLLSLRDARRHTSCGMRGMRRVRAARTEAPSLRLNRQPRVGAARSALRLTRGYRLAIPSGCSEAYRKIARQSVEVVLAPVEGAGGERRVDGQKGGL